MLKQIDNLSKDTPLGLKNFFGNDCAGLYTLFSLLDNESVDGAWVQTQNDSVTALVVKREMSKVFVTAADGADLYELADFISELGGVVVHCPSKITSRIGVTAFSKLSLMSLDTHVKSSKTAVNMQNDLRSVFNILTDSKSNILKKGIDEKQVRKISDKAYKQWLSGVEKGVLDGYTQALGVKVGDNSVLAAALAQKIDDTVFIRNIATDADYGKMGYSSDCIAALCNGMRSENGTVIVACNDIKSENFYKKIGFQRQAYLELGIVEL